MAPPPCESANEGKKIKMERPQTAQILVDCGANGGRKIVQRPLEKPRPSTSNKMLWSNHCDKESLLDELLELKNAMVQQAFHMELHVQHARQVQEENDRLEKNVENLELAYGLEAPRVGGESKLTSKLLGLKARLHEKQHQCNSQEVEIGLLQKDIRVTHCRELEIERDLFAIEVGVLQKSVRGLRRIFTRVNSENGKVQKICKKLDKLENRNKELKTNIQITKKHISNSKLENDAAIRQSSEAKSTTSSANSKFLELEAHSLVLAKLKRQEECETMKLEHSILKVGDNTRQILKDEIATKKAAVFAQYVSSAPVHEVHKKIKVPDQPSLPNEDAMKQLEAKFLAQVETAAVKFIGTVPACQPPSPKNEERIQEQHTTFETHKEFFTDKVEEAKIAFLMAMEAIEYGQAKTKVEQSPRKMLAVAEAHAKKLAEELKKVHDEVARLRAELDKLKGTSDKRWNNEKVSITIGNERLKAEDYKFHVVDKGVEIDVDIDIFQTGKAELDKLKGMESGNKRWKNEKVSVILGNERLKAEDYNVQVVDKGVEIDIDISRLKGAKANVVAEAKRINETLKKTQEERDRLVAELARLQDFRGKRWKSETVSIMMGNKQLAKEDYKFEVLDKGAHIDIDVQIQGFGKIIDELEAAKKSLLDDDSSTLIKSNFKEVLQHLENIAEVVQPKSSRPGPSKHDANSGGPK